MIGLTTGRQTTQRMNSLLNELAQVIPNARVVRRGKSNLNEFSAKLRNMGISHVVALHRWHGSPGRVNLFRVQSNGMVTVPPSIILSGIKLRREYGTDGMFMIEGVSNGAVNETLQLARTLSTVLDVPIMDSTSTAVTLHLVQEEKSLIRVVVTAPPGQRELGPSLNVSRLLWDDCD